MKKFILLITIIISCATASFAQYCAANANSTADEEITNFTFTTINNSTPCATPLIGSMGPAAGGVASLYADYTNLPPAAVLGGQSYPFSMEITGCTSTVGWSSGSKIYIDYNQNNTFSDPGEEVYFSGVGNAIICWPPSTVTGNIAIPITASPGITTLRVINVEGGQSSATFIQPCGTFTWGEVEDYKINIIPPVPCSGKPDAGTILPISPITVCPLNPVTLYVVGSSAMSALVYQWQKSVNAGATWTNIAGANSLSYTVPAATPSAWYRLIVTCSNNFLKDTSDTAVVNLTLPTYVPLPYTQSFESWNDYCGNNDVPDDNHWNNSPVFGNESWRRDDEGSTAVWGAPTAGQYNPAASHLNHSARFHSYNSFSNGNLDLYLNTTGQANSTLFFDYINVQGSDQLDVSVSTNGGATFTPALTVGNAASWTTDAISLPIASAQTIVRFTGNGDFSDDIGVDNIRAVPPCNSMPIAGSIHDTTVCPNRLFTMYTIGSSLAGGLDFEWQSAPAATGPWTVIGNTISNSIVTQIAAPTFFRVIVTCIGTGQSDTTLVEDITLKDFYYCYCDNSYAAVSWDDLDIGNVELKKNATFLINNVPLSATDTLSNINAINSYTNFQYLSTTPTIFVDSSYVVNATAITSQSWAPFGSTRVFIDYNRDGLFDPTNEVAGGATLNNSYTTSLFTVPTNAQQGFTGMRVIVSDVGSPSSIQPCGTYNSGETEDYLVYLSLPPCAPPSNPGTAYISEPLICAGYNVTLTDTTHTSVSAYNGLTTIWQESPFAAGPWTDIPGATGDTYTFIASANAFFRMKIVCKPGVVTLDSAYSNVVSLTLLPSNGCYPASASMGGISDTNDLGAFIIGTYSFITGGPHLGNPAAIKIRTDYTGLGAKILYTDSTYEAAIFSILKNYVHADSRITVFIDYNNNGVYDIPTERVYTGQSTNTTFYLPFTFTTIANPALGVPTGLRVILNNNILPNTQSDLGVGLYTSGETEDYFVQFVQKPPVFATGVNNILDLKNISIYPNPTSGIVYLDIESINLNNIKITVSNMIGQELMQTEHESVGNEFHTNLDLSKFAKGTYIIKIATDKGNTMQKVTLQ
jgi:hypothetical protein